MTRSSIRHAVFERCPEDREALIETVAEEMGLAEIAVDDTLEILERRGEVYVAGGEVRATGGHE